VEVEEEEEAEAAEKLVETGGAAPVAAIYTTLCYI
jgi:hypothetical protein